LHTSIAIALSTSSALELKYAYEQCQGADVDAVLHNVLWTTNVNSHKIILIIVNREKAVRKILTDSAIL